MTMKRNSNLTKKRGTSSEVNCAVHRSSVSGHMVTSTTHKTHKYGEIRPEVRDIVKRRLEKHASTWTELAKR